MIVDIAPRRLPVTPGTPQQLQVTVTNTGEVIGGYALRVLGADPGWVDADWSERGDQTFSLFPAESRTITITVIALDIDHFKRINDTGGHPAGDQYLVDRAQAWRTMAPSNAVVARLGGDEFAVCIADRAGPAPGAAERFVTDVRLHTPGTSIGIASRSGDGAEIATLLAAADADLYAAKHRTR